MIKLVAFDWNGTLLADTWAAAKADNSVLATFGHKTISLQQYRKTFDIPIIKYWTDNGFDKNDFINNAKSINEIFNLHYEPLADRCRTRGGSKEVLLWLKKQKIDCVIYSNHTTHNIHRQLVRLRIDQCIPKILAREPHDRSHMHERYKAHKLSAYIKKRKFKPQEVISVGDTEEEIEVGKKYGFHTVAITGGYNTTARLKKHHPDFLIHNLVDLIKIVKKLNKLNNA
jgi:phosphoglycolate phosphatase-like HAD superfamily hydrolase